MIIRVIATMIMVVRFSEARDKQAKEHKRNGLMTYRSSRESNLR